MRMANCLAALGAAGLMTAAGAANAAQLLVQNGDFNSGPAKADGEYYTGASAVPGWSGSSNSGHWDPGSFHIGNEAAHKGVALLTGRLNTGDGGPMFTQVVQGHTIQANTRYVLTLDVARYAGLGFEGFEYDFGLIAGALGAGATIVAQMTGVTDAQGQVLVPGTFSTLSLVFETGAEGPELGQQLMIALGGTKGLVTYDNVFLEATPISSAVPEPAAWALMIAGFGAAGAMIRRRRQGMALA